MVPSAFLFESDDGQAKAMLCALAISTYCCKKHFSHCVGVCINKICGIILASNYVYVHDYVL